MKTHVLPLVAVAFAISSTSEVTAQNTLENWDRTEAPGALSINLTVATTDVQVTLEDTEIVLPENFNFGEFETSVAEDIDFKSTFVGAGVSYRALPFLTLNARSGFVSSESDIGFEVTGTPSDDFPGIIEGPVSFGTVITTSVEGFNFGVAATAIAPIASIGSKEVVGFASYQHSWSEYDDPNFTADYGRATAGVVFPVSLENPMQPLFRLGVGYTDVNRRFEREFTINGETARFSTRQGIDDPWSVDLGMILPASNRVQFAFGSTIQTTGNVSLLASLSFRP